MRILRICQRPFVRRECALTYRSGTVTYVPRHLTQKQNERAQSVLNELLKNGRQADVAKRTGWDQGSISRKSRGEEGFSVESAEKLATIAGIDIEVIMGDGTRPGRGPREIADWFRDRGADPAFAEAIGLNPDRWTMSTVAMVYGRYEGKIATAEDWARTLDRWEGLAKEEQTAAGQIANRRDVHREMKEQRELGEKRRTRARKRRAKDDASAPPDASSPTKEHTRTTNRNAG